MHLEISEHNKIYKQFNDMRIEEGYTTFKSAIIASMKLMLSQYQKPLPKPHEVCRVGKGNEINVPINGGTNSGGAD